MEVRQRDLAGNQGSASTAFAYTYDSLVPAIPGITGLTTDTGSSSTDKVTSNPALTLTNVEGTAVVEYSFDGGTTWSTKFVPPTQGAVSVEVRQRDLAGNQGSASTAFAYTYDTVVPAIPGITGLTTDTGSSSTDNVTSNPALTLTNVEGTAVVEYSFDGVRHVGREHAAAGRRLGGSASAGPGGQPRLSLDRLRLHV